MILKAPLSDITFLKLLVFFLNREQLTVSGIGKERLGHEKNLFSQTWTEQLKLDWARLKRQTEALAQVACGMCKAWGCSVVQLCWVFETLWTIALQAPLSMKFSRQEYWSRLSLPSAGDPPNPGLELASPALQAGSLPLSPSGRPLVYKAIPFLMEKINDQKWSVLGGRIWSLTTTFFSD